jgi:RND family efflux transporter MFP subunit
MSNGHGKAPAASPEDGLRRTPPLGQKGFPWIAVVIAVIAVGGLGLLVAHFAFGAKKEVAALSVAPVAAASRADLSREMTFYAEFRPYQEVALHAKVAGYVKEISVDIGDRVKAGQVVAVLEVPELKDDLHKATAATQTAQQDAVRAQADADDAHLAFTRLAQVIKAHPGLVAQQDVDTAQARDQGAQASLAAARQRIEEAKANESKMNAMLDYCSITAPFDGVVTKRFADTGALVQAGTASNVQALPVVALAEDDRLRLDFPVQESAVPDVRIGQPVEVTVSALGETFPAQVARFSGKIDTATRTMTTEVEIPNAQGRYTPGMYASVRLVLSSAKDALSVPIQALGGEDGKTVLVVGPDGKIEKRTVKTGLQTARRVQIADGLREGEKVVVAKGSQFQPGEKVVPKLVDLAD